MAKATVKVFIASSGEMKHEREKCISILNHINKSHRHLHLEPIEWEFDISHGSYPDFSGIQKAINPLLEESKLCVFMFHSKIGKYTEEEFALATELKKKLFAFFKKGFSPESKDEIEEWSKLLTFKKSMGATVLYKDYASITEFELALKDNLNLYLSEAFSAESGYEGKQLSPEVTTLLEILREKVAEIELLKATKNLADEETKKLLALLERDKKELTDQLNQSKEIQKQQAQDKSDVESRLAPQMAKDSLKQEAFIAIRENKYEEAKALLKESARESISDAASTFYELGKVSKLQLLYKEALHYFELAVKINPMDFEINMETGKILRVSGYNDKAIFYFENALSVLKAGEVVEESHLPYLKTELGLAYDNKGEYDKAIGYYEEALALDKKFKSDEHPDIATDYNNLGVAYHNKGEYDKAINYYEEALAIDKKFKDGKHPDIAVRYSNLGLTYDQKGEYDKAIDYYEKALATDKKFKGDEHPDVAIDLNNLGFAYDNQGEHDTAIEYYELALAIDRKFHGEDHPRIAIRYNNLGASYDSKGEFDTAIQYYERALVIDRKFHGEDHPRISTRYNNLGLAYYNKGEYDKAIDYYQQAIAMAEKFFTSNHPTLVLFKENLALAQGANKNKAVHRNSKK